jgi:hypothetical protein
MIVGRLWDDGARWPAIDDFSYKEKKMTAAAKTILRMGQAMILWGWKWIEN